MSISPSQDFNKAAPTEEQINLGKELLQELDQKIIDLKKVKTLIEMGAHLEQTDVIGNTPLLLAVHYGHQKVIEHLIDAKANINHKNNQNETALIKATRQNEPGCVMTLLKYKPNLEERSNGLKETALLIATWLGYWEIAKMLLDAGADFEAQDSASFTPFLNACSQGHLNIVKTLIVYGANIFAETSNGRTGMKLAENNGHRNVTDLLKTKMSYKDETPALPPPGP